MSREVSHTTHIMPVSLYLKIGGLLLILTGLTVFASFLQFGPYNLVIAMVIAATKASLVALFFMHLKYDNKLYMILFVSSLLFLATFIILTMFDTLTRGDINPETAMPYKPEAVIYTQPADSTAAAADSMHTTPDSSRTDQEPTE